MSATFRRWRRPNVQPLSIFDLELEGTPLWQRLGQPRVDSLRAAGANESRIGAELAATALAAIERLRERHRFERAFVGGGLTQIDGFAACLRGAADLSVDGAFVGERGGNALLGDGGSGVVVDVGQTAIKLSARGRRLVRARDLDLLPLELIDPGGAPPRPEPRRLERAADFIGGAIAEFGSRGDRIVLALPCPVDDACVPGPCTYGWQGEAGLVTAILERSGLAPSEVLVLNDAELAGETALLERDAPMLVLTLGFGPGAALVTRSDPG
jgi:hypothetical protein